MLPNLKKRDRIEEAVAIDRQGTCRRREAGRRDRECSEDDGNDDDDDDDCWC
jgi:hypothetical protein